MANKDENKAKKTKTAAPVEKDVELLQILNAQNDILDCMLTQQRKWLELEECINNMQIFSDAFVNLDTCRENCAGDDKNIYLSPKIESVYVSVRTKLSKSKIENKALATYVESTKDFINGVLDTCVPQQRNVRYNKYGKIVRPAAESVVLDTVM